MSKKSYSHLKINILKNLSYMDNCSSIIKLVEADKVEDALKEWARVNPQMKFSLSSSMAKMQVENMRNNLITLAEAAK